MKHYVVEYRTQNNGEYVGMAIAGPFDTRDEADAWVGTYGNGNMFLTCGPDDLGPDWESNKQKFFAGDLKEVM